MQYCFQSGSTQSISLSGFHLHTKSSDHLSFLLRDRKVVDVGFQSGKLATAPILPQFSFLGSFPSG